MKSPLRKALAFSTVVLALSMALPTTPVFSNDDIASPIPPSEIDWDAPPQAVRGFNCDNEGLGDEVFLADVDGEDGSSVFYRPADPDVCGYGSVYFKDSSGVETRLTEDYGGYLMAVAGKAEDNKVYVCATKLVHLEYDGPDAPPVESGAWHEIRGSEVGTG